MFVTGEKRWDLNRRYGDDAVRAKGSGRSQRMGEERSAVATIWGEGEGYGETLENAGAGDASVRVFQQK